MSQKTTESNGRERLSRIALDAYRDVTRAGRNGTSTPEIEARFYAYSSLRSTVRLRDGRVFLRVSDLLADAPDDALGGLARILFAKLLGRRVRPEWNDAYRAHAAKTEVMAASEELRGQRIPFVRCVLVGLRKLPQVLLVGLAAGVIVTIGLAMWILPGIFLACVLYVSVPAAVIEGGGVVKALTRSVSLTAGNRLQVFVVAAVSFAISYGLGRLAREVFEDNVQALWTARITLFVAAASFGAVTATVAYFQLLGAHGQAAPDDVARTFE